MVSVPPFATCKRTGFLAKIQIGSTDISSMGMLPAVSISASMLPPEISLGVNQSSLEASAAPSTLALHSLAAVITDSRCWRFSPGCGLCCLML